jgi:hypothetical protein
VHVSHSFEKGFHVLFYLLLIEYLILLLDYQIEQLTSVHVLHHQIYELLLVVCLIVPHDIGMVQSDKGVHLVLN